MTGTRIVLLSFALLGFGDGFAVGEYTHTSIIAMTVGMLLLTVPALLPDRFPLTVPGAWDLRLVVMAAFAAETQASAAIHIPHGAIACAALLELALLVALILICVPFVSTSPVALGFLAVAAVLALVAVHVNSPPHIDVWYLTQGATDSLLHGTDMYVIRFPDSTGIKDAFPYLPGLPALLLPFRLLGLDVRVGLLVATLVAAGLIWRTAPRVIAPFLAMLVVLVPGWMNLVQLSWNEPILLACLAGLFLAVERGRLGWAVLALGLALATKQHVLLILPLLAVWPAFGLRRVVLATLGAGAFVLPWFLIAPHAFLRGALYLNLDLTPRRDSLSVFSVALENHWTPPFFLVGALTLAAIGAAALLVRRHPSAHLVALGCAWVLGVFHLLNKQSFYNEWWLVITLLVVSVALAPAGSTSLTSQDSRTSAALA